MAAGLDRDERRDDSTRPLRILFFLYHAGYLRHYVEALRLLAAEGHVIHLGFTTIEKDAGDRVLAERLAVEFPRVTFGQAPRRARLDGWRGTSNFVRAFTDLVRYADPRYAQSPALRTRMAEKIRRQIVAGSTDPVSSRLLARCVDRIATRLDAGSGLRLLGFLRLAEQAIPTSRAINRFIRRFEPDAVLATPLVDYASTQVDFLKSAQSLGIPTAICVASWDNLTNKGLLRITPDRVLIWNEIQRRELEEMHGVPPERAVVLGAAKFDAWFERSALRSRDELAEASGLPRGGDYLLYVCSSYFIAPDEVSFVRRWLDSLRRSDRPELRDLGVIVRPHPQNSAQWRNVDLSGHGDAVVWPPVGVQPDDAASRADFFDSIHHSVAVVGVNTSAMIDAAIVGRNVLTVLDPAFASTQEGTLHFHYLLREQGGFLNIAADFEEHHAQLAEIVAGGVDESARVRRFVESFVRPRGIDLPVAPLVAEEFAALAHSVPLPRVRPARARIYAVRLGLLLPTIAGTLTVILAAAARRLTRRHWNARGKRGTRSKQAGATASR